MNSLGLYSVTPLSQVWPQWVSISLGNDFKTPLFLQPLYLWSHKHMANISMFHCLLGMELSLLLNYIWINFDLLIHLETNNTLDLFILQVRSLVVWGFFFFFFFSPEGSSPILLFSRPFVSFNTYIASNMTFPDDLFLLMLCILWFFFLFLIVETFIRMITKNHVTESESGCLELASAIEISPKFFNLALGRSLWQGQKASRISQNGV